MESERGSTWPDESAKLIDKSPSRLNRLPVELLHRIFVWLDGPSVRAARATCSSLATVGHDYLLVQIPLAFKRQDLERLRQIARHPVCSKIARSLHYQVDVFDGLLGFPYWNDLWAYREGDTTHEASDLPPSKALKRSAAGLEDQERELIDVLDEAYSRHQKIIRDRDDLHNGVFDVECLSELFRQCAKLNDVTIAFGDHGPLRPESRSRHRYNDDDEKPPWTYSRPRLPSANQEVRVLEGLIQAVLKAGRPLKRLRVIGVTRKLFSLDVANWNGLREVVAPLHEFHLDMQPLQSRLDFYGSHGHKIEDYERRPGYPPDHIYSYSARIRELLSSASELRVLRMELLSTGRGHHVEHLQSTIGALTWPMLRDVSLGRLRASEGQLRAFLLRHKHTLKRISLSHIQLGRGCECKSLFRSLHGHFPKLARIKLRGSFYASSETAEFEFGTPGFPISAAWLKIRDLVESSFEPGASFPADCLIDGYKLERERYKPGYTEEVYESDGSGSDGWDEDEEETTF